VRRFGTRKPSGTAVTFVPREPPWGRERVSRQRSGTAAAGPAEGIVAVALRTAERRRAAAAVGDIERGAVPRSCKQREIRAPASSRARVGVFGDASKTSLRAGGCPRTRIRAPEYRRAFIRRTMGETQPIPGDRELGCHKLRNSAWLSGPRGFGRLVAGSSKVVICSSSGPHEQRGRAPGRAR
jgi:hypothetical protein